MQVKDFEEQQARNEEQIPTYINLTITIEPLISVPQENEKEAYPGKEKTPFLTLGTDFAKDIYRKFKTNPRVVKVFLVNIDGQSVFIPRFLTPMQPPMTAPADGGFAIYDKDDPKAIERAARFVSLIPFVDDSQLFKDMPDLTCSSQEFLDLGAGDSEEHAMLLCNYFNFIDFNQNRQKKNDADTSKLDIHSYVVYGEAVPDGNVWFVARRCKINGYMELWNPMTAECYNFDKI